MLEMYELVKNDVTKRKKVSLDFLNEEVAKKTLKFHSSFEQYTETPLVELNELSKYIGLKDFFIKDESYRFGLNAFKVLGGSFAIGQYIANRLGKSIEDLPYKVLMSDDIKKELGELTFITATDGNHGRGIAWTAEQLKQKAIVYMPKGSSLERRDRIRAHGATCEITEWNYDDTVRYCNELAEKNGYVMVQDTSWEGYEDIPTWIMQGYMTMAYEAYLELEKLNKKPTHIFLQAGVGSLSSAVTGFFSSVYEDDKPIITIVEPDKAACLYKTAKADDGKLHPVTGEMNTIMAGLACGEPVTVGWPVLNANAENFLSVPDSTAAHGMRVLGNPLKGDERIISGESGAASAGVVSQVMTLEELKDIKESLKLDKNSIVLCFSTEGDTDFANYRDIVWNGLHSNK
ncbi:diaminopropionate ammonia-lyase [Sedimentibacter acidaminivorans]|uniref:Diaminopropionate ammonia-lyase n=1 Tax=Sedimentibacter acidaminivorans TaxID=913099 RepID=A0ABS4GDK9_9FIRM|nr:diaminopropionate ammonia-lyase [Sedimentibacter acidaminivorans]